MFEIDPGFVVAQILNFLIMFFIFKKFVSDGMNDLVEERRELLSKIGKADFYYDEKVKSAEEQKQNILNKARIESKQYINQSQEIASIQAQELIKKANSEVMYILDSGKKEVEKDRVDMLEEIEESALNLSIKLNKKLFNNSCQNNSFINKQMD
ncbi:MAG: ATP synthase F0 subunit B [Candidatus Gracilibacteria bacterium]